jgi:hypothetical protein
MRDEPGTLALTDLHPEWIALSADRQGAAMICDWEGSILRGASDSTALVEN